MRNGVAPTGTARAMIRPPLIESRCSISISTHGDPAETVEEISTSHRALARSIGGSSVFTQTAFNQSSRSRDDYREALERIADLKTDLVDADWRRAEIVGHRCRLPRRISLRDAPKGRCRPSGQLSDRRRTPCLEDCGAAYPAQFLTPNPSNPRERIALNPFVGVERVYGDRTTEPATRAQAYALAEALFRLGHPSLGAVPFICFEWLQRPENVLAGAISWTDYRPAHRPRHVRIEHWKTHKMVWQPLEDDTGPLPGVRGLSLRAASHRRADRAA